MRLADSPNDIHLDKSHNGPLEEKVIERGKENLNSAPSYVYIYTSGREKGGKGRRCLHRSHGSLSPCIFISNSRHARTEGSRSPSTLSISALTYFVDYTPIKKISSQQMDINICVKEEEMRKLVTECS